MKWFSWLSFFLVLPVLFAAAEVKELEIETIEKPSECPEIAESGDSVDVHYVRLVTNYTLVVVCS